MDSNGLKKTCVVLKNFVINRKTIIFLVFVAGFGVLLNTYFVTYTKRLLSVTAQRNSALEQLSKCELELQRAIGKSRDPATSQVYENESCPKTFSAEDIQTGDSKYFLLTSVNPPVVCDQTDKENIKLIGRIESQVQNGNIVVITKYGGLLFYADLSSKNLNYVDIKDFPDKEKYYNEDGSEDLWLFGPKEDKLDSFSPDGDKVVIGASNCHDCMGEITSYILNMKTGKITRLGIASDVRWINNNTVQWNEMSMREKTDQEYLEDPGSVWSTYEVVGTRTTIVE